MKIGDKELEFELPPWFFYVGLGLCAAVLGLAVLYAVRYPERNWFDDLTRVKGIRIPDDVSSLVDAPSSSDGEDPLG
jgi:hypothetical protein